MPGILSISLTELLIVAGVTGLTCCVPLLGAIVLVVVVLRQEEATPAERE